MKDRQREFNAILLQGVQPSAIVLDALAGIPSVWVMTRKSLDYPGDYVEPDNEANGRMAADFLAERGHSRVAYMTIAPEYPAFARREAAFNIRAAEHGCTVARLTATPFNPHAHVLGRPSDQVGEELAAQLLACDPLPGGIYMPNMVSTGVLYRGLRRVKVDPARFDWIVGLFESPHSRAY